MEVVSAHFYVVSISLYSVYNFPTNNGIHVHLDLSGLKENKGVKEPGNDYVAAGSEIGYDYGYDYYLSDEKKYEEDSAIQSSSKKFS